MLVEWQAIRLFVEFLELGVEPVREAVVDLFDGLADFAAARRGSAAARLKRNHERNPLVKRAGQQRGLTVAGMTDDGDTLRINGSVRDQIVNGSLQPPRPRSDRAPIVIGAYGRGPLPRIDAGSQGPDAVRLVDESFVVLQDLELTNRGDYGTVRRGVHVVANRLDLRRRKRRGGVHLGYDYSQTSFQT